MVQAQAVEESIRLVHEMNMFPLNVQYLIACLSNMNQKLTWVDRDHFKSKEFLPQDI